MARAHDLRVTTRDWLAVLGESVRSALLPIWLTLSVRDRRHVARETEYVVDDHAPAEIDRRLCAYFPLAPPAEDAGRA